MCARRIRTNCGGTGAGRVAVAARRLSECTSPSSVQSPPAGGKNRKLLEAHGSVIPPATTPPVVLAALQARVIARSTSCSLTGPRTGLLTGLHKEAPPEDVLRTCADGRAQGFRCRT